jgi:integrase/recombinase XerD
MNDGRNPGSPLRGLPVSAWPEPDRAIWLAALAPGDLLDEGGARSLRRSASNANLKFEYGRWLASLLYTGRLTPGDNAPPASRITVEAVSAYHSCMKGAVGTGTQIQRLVQLLIMARLLDPVADWSWLLPIIASLRRTHRPVRTKADVLVETRDLFALGSDLMTQAEALSGWERALRYRDGLIIALLALRPLRIGNFASLETGRHLHLRGAEWWIYLAPEETKNHCPLEMPIPAVLGARLQVYLSEHRLTLLQRSVRSVPPHGNEPVEPARVWLSKEGRPMNAGAFLDLIRRHTTARFGKALTPHLFRDCAVTSIARAHPARIGISGILLHHGHPDTATLNYNSVGTREAVVRLQVARDGGLGDQRPPSHPATRKSHRAWRRKS